MSSRASQTHKVTTRYRGSEPDKVANEKDRAPTPSKMGVVTPSVTFFRELQETRQGPSNRTQAEEILLLKPLVPNFPTAMNRPSCSVFVRKSPEAGE